MAKRRTTFAFDSQKYTSQAEFVLAGDVRTTALMDIASRRKYAEGFVRAFQAELTLNSTTKPATNIVRGRMWNDKELRTFVPAWLLMILAGWAVQKLLDWLWDAWTKEQNGEPD